METGVTVKVRDTTCNLVLVLNHNLFMYVQSVTFWPVAHVFIKLQKLDKHYKDDNTNQNIMTYHNDKKSIQIKKILYNRTVQTQIKITLVVKQRYWLTS